MDIELRNNIIKALGLDSSTMTEVQMNDVIERVGTLIYQNVLQKIMDRLPEEDIDEFGRLMDEEVEHDKITAFLKSKVPDFDDLIRAEAKEFVEESRDLLGK